MLTQEQIKNLTDTELELEIDSHKSASQTLTEREIETSWLNEEQLRRARRARKELNQ